MPRRQVYGTDGKPLEWVIQDAILEYLMERERIEPMKFWRARPSQYIRKQGSNVGFRLHSSEIGMPDIMGTAFGFTLGMEVKRPGGAISTEQKNWRRQFLKAPRTAYRIVRSLQDVEKFLDEVRTRERESE